MEGYEVLEADSGSAALEGNEESTRFAPARCDDARNGWV